jgi:bifunctional ADP-heptose synthase (sugar kinase/adenylyltransferase)
VHLLAPGVGTNSNILQEILEADALVWIRQQPLPPEEADGPGDKLNLLAADVPVKNRVMLGRHQLARFDWDDALRLKDGGLSLNRYSQTFVNEVKIHIDIWKPRVAIISDYAKGAFNDESVFNLCQSIKVPYKLADPKRSFKCYPGTILTPNWTEFLGELKRHDVCRYGSWDQDSLNAIQGDYFQEQVFEAAELLVENYGLTGIVLKLGEYGALTVIPGILKTITPAYKPSLIYDVTGAGDTFIAGLAASLADKGDDRAVGDEISAPLSSESIQEAVEYATIAAGISVGLPGTAVVNNYEVHMAQVESEAKSPSFDETLNTVYRIPFDCMELSSKIKKLKHLGRPIVLTNGCFDLFGSNHAQFLEWCYEQTIMRSRFSSVRPMTGEPVLFVAVDTDNAVARLKGSDRPIRNELERALLVKAHRRVTGVILFDNHEEFRQIVDSINPDFLMKGYDYAGQRTCGDTEVKTYGGVFVTSPKFDGPSTTELIAKIAGSAKKSHPAPEDADLGGFKCSE